MNSKEIIFWGLSIISALGSLTSIVLIGEKRSNYTTTYAVVSVLSTVAFVWLLHILKS